VAIKNFTNLFFFLYFTTGGCTSAATRAYKQIYKNFVYSTITNKLINSQELNLEDDLVFWRVGDTERDAVYGLWLCILFAEIYKYNI
jgi:hypothetical protein